MEKYRNREAALEERLDDLMSRMTLEEKILQTDQFFTFDFCDKTAKGRVTKVRWEDMKSSMHGMSVGSVQLRGCTPIVLVLQNGRPLALTWEQENIPAILECWYSGEKGGQAIAEVLFGKVSPSGRLPMSFPKSVGQVPCNYNRLPGGGKRYVEMDWEPLYPFGYGLTYTTFAYSNLEVSDTDWTAQEIENGKTVKVSFTVTNTGDVEGEETAQLYVRDCCASTVKPMRELAGFAKVKLLPGESKRLTFELGNRQLRTLNSRYEWHVEPGEFQVMAADNAANVLLKEGFLIR